MSTYCKSCGREHHEDDGRLCAKCSQQDLAAELAEVKNVIDREIALTNQLLEKSSTLAAELAEAKRHLTELVEGIDRMSCHCDEAYTSRGMTDPTCTRCDIDICDEDLDAARAFLTRPTPSPPANELERLREKFRAATDELLNRVEYGNWSTIADLRGIIDAALTPAPVADEQDAARHGSEGGK